jgi:hypothetical protein
MWQIEERRARVRTDETIQGPTAGKLARNSKLQTINGGKLHSSLEDGQQFLLNAANEEFGAAARKEQDKGAFGY